MTAVPGPEDPAARQSRVDFITSLDLAGAQWFLSAVAGRYPAVFDEVRAQDWPAGGEEAGDGG